MHPGPFLAFLFFCLWILLLLFRVEERSFVSKFFFTCLVLRDIFCQPGKGECLSIFFYMKGSDKAYLDLLGGIERLRGFPNIRYFSCWHRFFWILFVFLGNSNRRLPDSCFHPLIVAIESYCEIQRSFPHQTFRGPQFQRSGSPEGSMSNFAVASRRRRATKCSPE